MTREITLVGAPSSIGMKPYANGEPRWLDRAPGVLRGLGLATRLGACDAGDVEPPPYRDYLRSPGRVRNEVEVAQFSRDLAARVGEVLDRGRFALVLGGDCSIVLGCCLAGSSRADVGLAYLDVHADFATPAESHTGSAAGMCLALVVGRGGTQLARLGTGGPLVRAGDVALVGRRDAHELCYEQSALALAGVLDLPDATLRCSGPAATAEAVLERVARADLAGFWIHLGVGLLEPDVMPAVASPTPGGPGLDDLAVLLAPLVRHPRALGMELTFYDPRLDARHACAERLIGLLVRTLGNDQAGA